MVVRTAPPENGKGVPGIAAGIWDYRVLHEDDELRKVLEVPHESEHREQP